MWTPTGWLRRAPINSVARNQSDTQGEAIGPPHAIAAQRGRSGPPHARSHRAASALGVATLLGLVGCGSGASEIGILINLANSPARINRIGVTTSLDGKPGTVDQSEFPATGLSRFAVTVPGAASGNLNIDLKIYDVDRCTQGTAQVMASLPAARGTQVTANITQQSPRRCEPLLPCADRTLCTIQKTQNNKLWSIWAIAHNDVWAVGESATVLHWDGTTWALKSDGIPAGVSLSSVWASGPSDVWAVGGSSTATAGYIYRFDGSSWKQTHSGPRYINWVHGADKDTLFAVGTVSVTPSLPGVFLRWNSSTSAWDTISGTPSRDLFGVWVQSATEVWVAGGVGTLLRYNGMSLNPITIGATNDLQTVHGYVTSGGQTIVYAAGKTGIVVRYDGSPRITNVGSMTHNSVLATPEAVYVVSGSGTVYKSPGITDVFTPFTTGTETLLGVSLASNGIAWIVGTNGFTGYLDTRP